MGPDPPSKGNCEAGSGRFVGYEYFGPIFGAKKNLPFFLVAPKHQGRRLESIFHCLLLLLGDQRPILSRACRIYPGRERFSHKLQGDGPLKFKGRVVEANSEIAAA